MMSLISNSEQLIEEITINCVEFKVPVMTDENTEMVEAL